MEECLFLISLFVGDGDEDLPRKTYHESHAWMMTDIEKAYQYVAGRMG